jgi:GH25 family lysozyme M1 (1,4-beta-N-acetylmuramidase)
MRPSRILAAGIATAVAALGLAVTGAPARALPTPSGYPVKGVDVSYFQGPSLDWAALAAAGNKFAYLRASEQNGALLADDNPDPTYATNYTNARARNIYTGAYHRARPGLSSGRQQADTLLRFAPYAHDGRTLPPMLDIEWPRSSWGLNDCYNMTAAQLVAWIRDFVTEIAARTGRQATIYTNTNWWIECTGNNAGFGANPLFLANYSQNPPPLPAGWSAFTLWQYAAGVADPSTGWSTPDQDVLKGDEAVLARLLGGSAVSLLARSNGRYVTAENAGTQPLIANRTAIGLWEQFDRIDAGGGMLALRARANGRYVTAESAGTQPLIANRTVIGAWEKFRLIRTFDGTYVLLANANGRYVTASATAPLIADAVAIGTAQKFRLVTPPTVTSLIAAVNYRYVTAPGGGGLPLIASQLGLGTAEQFDEIAIGGSVAFRSHANGRYVTAAGEGTQPLVASRTVAGTWERFRVVANADGTVSLQANGNGRYVSAESAGTQPLIANRTVIGSWERFFRVTG